MKKPLIPSTWLQDNSRQEKSNAITTLISVPNKITLSENMSNFKFKPVKTGYTPQNSTAIIQIGAYVPIGTEVVMRSGAVSIVLTASLTPSTNEFITTAIPPIGSQLVEYVQMVAESIADTLNQSLALFNNYSVLIFNGAASVTANRADSYYDFTTLTTTSNSILLINQLGAAEFLSQEQIGYTSFCNIYVGSQLYDSVVQKNDCIYAGTKLIDSSTQESNIAASSVGNYLNHILPLKSLTPFDGFYQMDKGVSSGGLVIPNEDDFGTVNLLLRPYFLEYGDKFSYVENQTKKSYTKGVSEIRWMQLGSFDELLPYDMSEFVWNPSNPFSFKWMTSCPNSKRVTYNSHEFIQTICKHSSVSRGFYLQVFCYFYDGTSTRIDKDVQDSQNIGGNVSFDVSPLALNIKGIEQGNVKMVDYYDVRLVWSYNGLSDGSSSFKRFRFDRNCYTDSKEVIFVNEYGAWDSLEFRGEIVEGLSRGTRTIKRTTPSNANTVESISSEVSININTEVQTYFTLNTGLLATDMVKWSKKLSESSAVYIWDENYSKYRSILIKETSYVLDSVQTGSNLEMIYTYTTQNNTISR